MTSEEKKSEKTKESWVRSFGDSLGKNPKLILIPMLLLVGLAVLGLVWQNYQESQERKWQAEYYQIEKDFYKKKDGFAQAKAEALQKKDEKIQDQSKIGLKTGDLSKDYGTVLESLQSLVSQGGNTQAATMARLLIAQIQLEYGQFQEAQKVLKEGASRAKESFLKGLLLNLLGAAQANAGDCESALKTWDMVLENKQYLFLHPNVLLRQGACLESENKGDAAELKYLEASQGNGSGVEKPGTLEAGMGQSPVKQEAERLLKALRIRKNSK